MQTLCAAGKYQPSAGSADCLLCPAGQYIHALGSDALSDCIDCVAGKYVATTGNSNATDCIDCMAGKYLNGKTVSHCPVAGGWRGISTTEWAPVADEYNAWVRVDDSMADRCTQPHDVSWGSHRSRTWIF